MNNKRDYLVILSDVVSACNESRGVTHIMMASGLNYMQVRRYLREAINKKFVRIVDSKSRNLYMATARGLEFIKIIKDLGGLISGNFVGCSASSITPVPVDVADMLENSKSSRRGKLDLYACILFQALTPISLTVLCNRCFMNRVNCVGIVKELVGINLLKKYGGSSDKRIKALYGTTNKGLCYLHNYMKVIMLLRP